MITHSDDTIIAAESSHTSLASTYGMVTVPPDPCGPRFEPMYMIDLRTHAIFPMRCRRNSCGHCLPINARRRALAMTMTRPRRMIRVSLVAAAGDADPMATARVRFKRLRQALKRLRVPSGEWCWTIEVNPAGTGYHAHAVQHGPFIDQAQLQLACVRAGAGIPYINEIKSKPALSSRYGLKAFGATGYGLKTYGQSEDAMAALELNHGRVEHHTPGFFVINGEKVTPREAETIAIKELYGDRIDSYILVTRRGAQYYADPQNRDRLPRPVPRTGDNAPVSDPPRP